MTMRDTLLSCSIASLLTTSPVWADATTSPGEATQGQQQGFNIGGIGISFQPRVVGGVMYYEYEQDGIGGTTPLDLTAFEPQFEAITGSDVTLTGETAERLSGFTVRATFPTIGVGGTLFVDRFFVDAYGQHAFTQTDDDSQESFQSTTFTATGNLFGLPELPFQGNGVLNQERDAAFDVDLDRTEWTVSAGYAFTDHFAAYAGYKQADTNFDFENINGTFNRNFVVAVVPLFTEPPVPTGGSISPSSGTFTLDQEIEFEQEGPFVGATFGLPLSGWIFDGLLAFNAAVAFLDGEVTQRTSNFSETTNGVTTPGPGSTAVVEGDTIGLSLGLSWRGFTPLEGLAYLISVDGHKYDFDGDRPQIRLDDGTEAPGPQGIEFDEFSISFRAGLSYTF